MRHAHLQLDDSAWLVRSLGFEFRDVQRPGRKKVLEDDPRATKAAVFVHVDDYGDLLAMPGDDLWAVLVGRPQQFTKALFGFLDLPPRHINPSV
jgi:hypothetical protein